MTIELCYSLVFPSNFVTPFTRGWVLQNISIICLLNINELAYHTMLDRICQQFFMVRTNGIPLRRCYCFYPRSKLVKNSCTIERTPTRPQSVKHLCARRRVKSPSPLGRQVLSNNYGNVIQSQIIE